MYDAKYILKSHKKFIVAVLCFSFMIGFCVFSCMSGSNVHQDVLADIQQSLNSMAPKDRQSAALGIITQTESKYSGDQQIIEAARTGSMVNFDLHYIPESSVWFWSAFWFYFTLSICLISLLFDESIESNCRVIDLEPNVGNVIFIIITLFPIGWLVYPYSAIELHRDKRSQKELSA